MRTCKNKHKYILTIDQQGRKIGCPDCQKEYSKNWHQKRKLTVGYLKYHKNIQAKWYNTHKNSEIVKIKYRGSRLKNRYWPHLTGEQALEEYDRILKQQQYRCAICKVHESEYKEYFHVDHCHTTNIVRGLLCVVCNRYIVGGIDTRAKAQKVTITKKQLINNVFKYYKLNDPVYNNTLASATRLKDYLEIERGFNG